MTDEIEKVEEYRNTVEIALNRLISDIGIIQICPPDRFPFGWRESAKGRTVWRLVEEAITQNLEVRHQDLGLASFSNPDSEVGVYDFICSLDKQRIFVNIKSATKGAQIGRDDISKYNRLEEFFAADANRILLIGTFEIEFLENMRFRLDKCTVVPVMWLPDISLNTRNNNLQSSRYKDINQAVKRSGQDFLELLRQKIATVEAKKKAKKNP